MLKIYVKKLWALCIQGFLKSKLESKYSAMLGLSSSEWGQSINEMEKLPAVNLDGLCGFVCGLKATCDRFVVDGPNCYMGHSTTTDGSVTNTIDDVWTAYQKIG